MTVGITPDVTVTAITPGAGGYGPPGERREADLVDDLENGLFSAGFMKEYYDFEATDDLPVNTVEEPET